MLLTPPRSHQAADAETGSRWRHVRSRETQAEDRLKDKMAAAAMHAGKSHLGLFQEAMDGSNCWSYGNTAMSTLISQNPMCSNLKKGS